MLLNILLIFITVAIICISFFFIFNIADYNVIFFNNYIEKLIKYGLVGSDVKFLSYKNFKDKNADERKYLLFFYLIYLNLKVHIIFCPKFPNLKNIIRIIRDFCEIYDSRDINDTIFNQLHIFDDFINKEFPSLVSNYYFYFDDEDSQFVFSNYYVYDYYRIYYYSWYDIDLYTSTFIFFIENFVEDFKSRDLAAYNLFKHYNSKKLNLNKLVFIYLLPVYSLAKSLLIAVILIILIFFLLIFYFYINFLKQLALWLMLGFIFFWLMSGFNFFLKHSLFGKLTSALMRFWKRTNTYFWLVEGFLFLLFFYYYLNSSQEPVYMYDYSSLNQTYLPNLWVVYCNTFLLVIIIVYLYFWLLSLSGYTSQQNIFHSFLISTVFLYLFFIETYQFYYVLTIFYENYWFYNHEQNIWVLEFESPRLRLKHQYLILALIAKYWHFIFIFISWVFFLVKFFEQKRAYYTHTGFNIQNIIILFWLNFLFIMQWTKWISRRFLDSIYYWFFTDTNFHFLKYFFFEINIIIYGVWHKRSLIIQYF